MSNTGDMAEEVADSLQKQHLDAINQNVVEISRNDSVLETVNEKSLFAKMRFRWRDEDRLIIEQIRPASQQVFLEIFAETIDALDSLYSRMRFPQTRIVDGQEVVVRDEQGRYIWKVDERGKPLESFSQLTGQDISETLFELSRLKLEITPKLANLMLEAVFAKYIADDTYYQGYESAVEGTQGDRTAKAHRTSIQDRYHAFFHYWIWQVANSFNKEIENFMWKLEKIADRRIWQDRSSNG